MNNIERQGHFTSSQIYKLIPFGKVLMTEEELIEFRKNNPKSRVKMKEGGFSQLGLTYIREKKLEIRMGRCLDIGGYSQATAWGNFMEFVIFSLLGLEYKMQSKDTFLHPNKELGKYWSGSVDLLVPNVKVAEIKCYQPKNFGFYADCLMQKDVDLFRKEFPAEYWQIVSNSIIHNVDRGEAILYMPYESEMDDIKEMARDYEAEDSWKYRFIAEKDNKDLPCLPDGGYYENIVKFEFEIPKKDKVFLTSRVEEAIIKLKE